ncbi:MAG: hypothetical protein KAI64_06200 [Thermoplasmata archaeon]|nr:hypothetical protein [Thermoplasmata archaeon]
MAQIPLFDKTDEEKIASLYAALEKHGRHSLFCCWVRDPGYYDKSLGCTCGLGEFINENAQSD